MKNYLKIWLQEVFPRKTMEKEKIYNLLKNRNFLDRKEDIFSILPYKNKVVRESILDLKFKNHMDNADFFGELLLECLPDYLQNLEIQENFYNPILITVPISF